MSWLIASDLHLTTKPEHEYRWEFMDWLRRQSLEPDVSATFLLGDISDAKDNHSALMVNRVVDAMCGLAHKPLYILFGNHDGPSQDRPYWQFLDGFENIRYITGASQHLSIGARGSVINVLMSPWGAEMQAIERARQSEFDFLFLHASVDGVRVENGMILPGSTPAKFLPDGYKTKVWSGDIHTPQIVGDVEYVGAPYQVHFGDRFEGRVIKQNPLRSHSYRFEELHCPNMPKLHAMRIPAGSTIIPNYLKPGDRVKLAAQADSPMLPGDWQQYVRDMRARLEAQGVTLVTSTLERCVTVEPALAAPSARRSDSAIVRTYAERQQYDEQTTAAGLALVKPL